MMTHLRANPADETIHLGPIAIRFLITAEDSSGTVAVFEGTVPGGQRLAAPAHSHDHYEETIYVTSGILSFTVDGTEIDIGPGQALPEGRGSLLESACGGDPVLRSEVESLLRSDSHAGDFLSSEKLRSHIPRIGSAASAPAVGSEIGPYRIVSAIGAGAMGEVYLARDTRLDRQVALKVLPQRFTGHSGRVSRFMREAKAASALNHPNIITIPEIGSRGGSISAQDGALSSEDHRAESVQED